MACALLLLGIGFGVVRPDPAAAAGPRVVYTTGTPSSLGVRQEDGTRTTIATPPGGSLGYTAPRWSGDGTRIAAVLNRGDAQCVAVMNADGGAFREFECGETTSVGWSPDGQRLVVGALGRLVIVNADGSGRRPVPNVDNADQPDWSPDGTKIVYIARGVTTSGLRVIAPDGSAASVLTPDTDQPWQFPRWSPDGTRIVADHGGNPAGVITILRADGTDTGATFERGFMHSPRFISWASGGAQLCFSETRGDSGNPLGVFVRSADGSDEPTQLLGEDASNPDCLAGASAPASPATTVPLAAPDDAGDPTDADAADETAALDPGRAATKRASDAAHRLGRSSFATALRAPDQVSTDVGLILANLALAVGFVVLVFPAVLLNSTLEEHYDEIRGWFGRGPRKARAPRGTPTRWAAFVAVGVVMSLIYALVDPKAKADQATALLVAGMAGAAMIDTLFGGVISSAFLSPRTRERGRIRSYPGALLIGAGGVAVSRAVNFLPGYLYGVVGGFDREVEAKKSDAGAAAALGALGGVVLAVGAWFLFQPVSEAAAKRGAALSTLVVEAVLAAMATLSFQSLLFSMVPIRMLPGAKVWAWNRLVWALFIAVGAFSILHLFLHPTDSYTGSVVVMLALFAGFGALSVAFWAYFRFRKPRPESPPPAPVPAPPTARRQRPLRAADR
jgi:hypothetical protein